MKALAWVAALGFVFVPAHAVAQAPGQAGEGLPGPIFESGADWLGGLAQAMEAEPLTPEQQERLPAAEALLDAMLPPGSLGPLMGGGFNQMLLPIRQDQPRDAAAYVRERLGMGSAGLELDEAQAERAASLLDPVWRERQAREAEIYPRLMSRAGAALEAPLRRAMAELYAINFTSAELADIAAFFATPSGAAYARRSLSLSSDPRLAMAAMSAMPAMMQAFAEVEAEIAAVAADLPPERRYSELGDADRKRLAQLVGMSREELDAQMLFLEGGEPAGSEIMQE
ncbi:DUF2059 domain-containing protein [Altererythrobacter lauratis]|uniref:DUF2059 domain-containing protein n=1 Tax=Alteraurantiacibacter lauratis TaxID=2054627 RepID=A0ABV7EAL9_9SPHN